MDGYTQTFLHVQVATQQHPLDVDEDEEVDMSSEVVINSTRRGGRGRGRGGRQGGTGRGASRGGAKAGNRGALAAASTKKGKAAAQPKSIGRVDEVRVCLSRVRTENVRRVTDESDFQNQAPVVDGRSKEAGGTHGFDGDLDAELPHDDYYPDSDSALDLPDDTVLDSSSSVGPFNDEDEDFDMDDVSTSAPKQSSKAPKVCCLLQHCYLLELRPRIPGLN